MGKEARSWTPAEGFECLHKGRAGQAVVCEAAGRLIVESHGLYLILRPVEVVPLLNHFHSTLTCPFTRERLERGGTLRIRDALRGHSADLALAAIMDLVLILESIVANSSSPSERPDPPYQSAIIDNAIAVRAFPSQREEA